MIKLQSYTPEVYYKQSRDFQFIGRLYDLVLNSVKTNVDMIYDIPKSDLADSALIDLLALTLGFKATHVYNTKQLAAICSILPTILKYKGTQYAINLACQAVLTAEGIVDKHVIIIENYCLQLFIPATLSEINLLSDLLYYILPAGMTCEINRTTNAGQIDSKTIAGLSSSPEVFHNVDISQSLVWGTADNHFDTLSIDDRDRNYVGMTTNSTTVRKEGLSQLDSQDENNGN